MIRTTLAPQEIRDICYVWSGDNISSQMHAVHLGVPFNAFLLTLETSHALMFVVTDEHRDKLKKLLRWAKVEERKGRAEQQLRIHVWRAQEAGLGDAEIVEILDSALRMSRQAFRTVRRQLKKG